jgi:hypothetical protein
MREKIVKRVVVLMTALALFCLNACSFPGADRINKILSEESALIRDESEEIIRCLTEGDKDGFCALFSEEIRNSDYFTDKVDDAFSFFDCDVYLISQIQEAAGGSGSTDHGKYTERTLSPEITYIKVLQAVPTGVEGGEVYVDRYYQVRYRWIVTDEDHPERVGIQELEIELLNTDQSVMIGIPE